MPTYPHYSDFYSLAIKFNILSISKISFAIMGFIVELWNY